MPQSRPKISVIVPVFRAEEYIERCVLSVIHQQYQNIELILVDDACGDSSIELAEKAIHSCREEGDFSLIIIRHEQRKGLSAARNSGINAACGSYLFFLDADDEITEDCLEKLMERALSTNADVVMGEHCIVNCGQEKRAELGFTQESVVGNEKVLDLYLDRKWYVMAWNKLIKRDVVLGCSLFFPEGYIFEDELWSFKLATSAGSLATVREALYRYHLHEGSITSRNKGLVKIERFLSLMVLYKQYIAERGLQNHPKIARFYIEKTIPEIFQANQLKTMDLESFKQYHSLFYYPVRRLLATKEIGIKQFLAWKWADPSMGDRNAYYYFRVVSRVLFERHKKAIS